MPLGKAMRMQTGKNYLLYILTIVAGATMAHSLVPPTPGPLTVVGFFDGEVKIGEMILGGLVVGIVTVTVGYFYAILGQQTMGDSPSSFSRAFRRRVAGHGRPET